MSRIGSHFLDSGSFTLLTRAARYGTDNGCSRWDYYDTADFWAYIDGYASFVKRHRLAIDLFANVDAIPDPDITWRNQRYLEREHSLDPVPVVHYRTDLSWLSKYIARGRHEVIALGGLVGADEAGMKQWLDRVFTLACPRPSRLPVVKLHGFGVSSFAVMRRYPWWSVDSSTWTKVGAFGSLFVPPLAAGGFDFSEPPLRIFFTPDAPSIDKAGKHYDNLTGLERRTVEAWLREIGISLAAIRTSHDRRKIANVHYLERLKGSIPDYPWPFRVRERGRMFS